MSSSSPSFGVTLSIIKQHITRYVFSLFLIFGVTGCCLNVILLSSQRQFRTITCCLYMMVASVMMAINLFVGISVNLYTLDSIRSSTLSPTFFKIYAYTLQSSAMMFRWCLVAASLDRYTLSSISLRLRNFAKMHIARRAVIAIVVVWIILPIHNLIYNTAYLNTTGAVSVPFILYYHSIFTALTGCILPASIMLICAVLTYQNLIRKQQRRQVIVVQQGRTNQELIEHERKRDRQAFSILIVQVVLFVITISPLMSYYFYNAITLGITNKSVERLAIEQFCWFLAQMSVYLFPTLSFYLYTMTSSIYRNELLNLIRSIIRCRCLRGNTRIEPTANSIERGTVHE